MPPPTRLQRAAPPLRFQREKFSLVDPKGFEPLASGLQSRRSSQLS